MAAKSLCLLVATALLAYYMYVPVPEDIEDRWKVMLINTAFRTIDHLAGLVEWLGMMHYIEALKVVTATEYVPPTSDENVTVTETEFVNVPVRLYVPRKQPDGLRRALIYFHGGGWCLGDAGMKSYDQLSRQTSNDLNAVVVSVNYRLAPQHRFPAQFEDVYAVTKFFLQRSVLSRHGVDPARVAVAGDSAGGNLAAAVAQQLLNDPEVETKLKAQALIYPALQTLDLNLPSYQENKNKPILPRAFMIRFWSEYFATDAALQEAMASNQHVPPDSSHLFAFVNWSVLLPEEMRRGYEYRSPAAGRADLAARYPGLLDVRAAPLLAGEAALRGLPRTYVLTCAHDVLRDDGAMYAQRLRAAGVPVTHQHARDAFHGALTFISGFMELPLGHRLTRNYLLWLNDNL